MKREETRAFQVGNLTLGGNNHVIIQSMTNTKTKNVEATVKQIQELEDAGCEMVRMAGGDRRADSGAGARGLRYYPCGSADNGGGCCPDGD